MFLSHLELSPEDKTSNCINYPTQDYVSYSQCDKDYIRKELPVGLIPFWTVSTDHINLASNNSFVWNISGDEFQFLYKRLGLFDNAKRYSRHNA